MKLCYDCKHCSLSEYFPDYSEYTPGTPFRLKCDKKMWDCNHWSSLKEVKKSLQMANTCKHFEKERDVQNDSS